MRSFPSVPGMRFMSIQTRTHGNRGKTASAPSKKKQETVLPPTPIPSLVTERQVRIQGRDPIKNPFDSNNFLGLSVRRGWFPGVATSKAAPALMRDRFGRRRFYEYQRRFSFEVTV